MHFGKLLEGQWRGTEEAPQMQKTSSFGLNFVIQSYEGEHQVLMGITGRTFHLPAFSTFPSLP